MRYFTCNLTQKEAFQYGDVPETYGNLTGMKMLSEEKLRDLAWAGMPGTGFIREDLVQTLGISAFSIKQALTVAQQGQRLKVIATRDFKLADSDKYVVIDRWSRYTLEQQNQVAAYRQALRDIGSSVTDWFNVVWPVLPNFVT